MDRRSRVSAITGGACPTARVGMLGFACCGGLPLLVGLVGGVTLGALVGVGAPVLAAFVLVAVLVRHRHKGL